MLVDISLDCVVSQTSASTFPHVSPLTNMMIVLRRSLYSVFYDGHAFGLFAALPPPVSIGFTQEANISLEAGFFPNFVSQCGVRRCSLTVSNHLDSYSTFQKANVMSRALSSHFISFL